MLSKFIISILSDFRPLVPNVAFGLVAATFRLSNLEEIFIYPSDAEKRWSGRAAAKRYQNESLNLGNS